METNCVRCRRKVKGEENYINLDLLERNVIDQRDFAPFSPCVVRPISTWRQDE
jgi:hypothetical protein